MNEIGTREELLAALREDAGRLPEVVGAIGEGDLERGVYENGWSARELLAHLAAIEWTYPRLIERAAAPGGSDGSDGSDGSSDSSSGGAFDMDAYNARQVAKRAEAGIGELLEEFGRNREATIEAVANADAALLDRATRSAGGVEGTLLEVLIGVTVGHVREHMADLAGEGCLPD